MNTQTLVADIETELGGTWPEFTVTPENTTDIVVKADISPAETGGGSSGGGC